MLKSKEDRIKEQLDHCREFWWKDMPCETYLYDVEYLMEVIYVLKAELTKLKAPSPTRQLLESVYGKDADIREWTKEETEAYRERMDKAMEKHPRPGLLPSPRHPRLPRKRE